MRELNPIIKEITIFTTTELDKSSKTLHPEKSLSLT